MVGRSTGNYVKYWTLAANLDQGLPVLTLGGTSSEGAGSGGLGWGWDCGSVRAGVDDEDGDEDGW